MEPGPRARGLAQAKKGAAQVRELRGRELEKPLEGRELKAQVELQRAALEQAAQPRPDAARVRGPELEPKKGAARGERELLPQAARARREPEPRPDVQAAGLLQPPERRDGPQDWAATQAARENVWSSSTLRAWEIGCLQACPLPFSTRAVCKSGRTARQCRGWPRAWSTTRELPASTRAEVRFSTTHKPKCRSSTLLASQKPVLKPLYTSMSRFQTRWAGRL